VGRRESMHGCHRRCDCEILCRSCRSVQMDDDVNGRKVTMKKLIDGGDGK